MMAPGFPQVKRTLLSRWVLRLAGVGLFALILANLDVPGIVSTIARLQPIYVMYATILFPLLIILKALRWQSLMGMQGIQYGFMDSLLAYFAGLYLGVVTPGRLGELLRAVYVRNEKGVRLARSISSVLVDRLMDLLVLGVTAFAGLFVFARSGTFVTLGLASTGMFAAASAPILSERMGSLILTLCRRLLIFRETAERLRPHFGEFYEGIRMLHTLQIAVPLALSVAGIGTFYGLCYLLALSLNIAISPFYLACSMSIANFASLVPLSISGIGTRDLVLIGLFGSVGLSAETAVAFSLIFLLYFTGLSALLGLLAWLIKPLGFRSDDRT